MLISPPFLPARNADESTGAWIDRCMRGGTPGQGAFPVSERLGWHGGLHLIAPARGNQTEPVRAIADGTVVYKRDATRQPPGPLPAGHPQVHRGRWTDDGVVVIRHDTEIGEGANAAVSFFSISMHLGEVDAAVRVNQPVYRKARLGLAGQIDGSTQRQIHFEIVCDDANLRRLAGRAGGELAVTTDGRTDAIFGEMYFRLPVGTPVYGVKPAPNHAQATMSAEAPPGRRQPLLQPVHVTTEVLIAGLRFAGGEASPAAAGQEAGGRGDAWLTTYRPDGSTVGTPLRVPDGEYDLYAQATAISQSYPAGTRPAPSAVFELLRFGRVIGPDALNPADVPHWREVRFPGGQGWVNLNAREEGRTVRKFSDADFPPWKRWCFVADDADANSRCDSATIKGWLDTDGDNEITDAEATARLSESSVAAKAARSVCKFPTEWDGTLVQDRWGWAKTRTSFNPEPISDDDFGRFERHISALAFWPAQTSLQASCWHWQPREFIRLFRRCGWSSETELVRALAHVSQAGRRSASAVRLPMNKTARKYGIDSSALRTSHFLAQIGHETGWWTYREEIGRNRYFRTMYEIITREEAADDFRTGVAAHFGLVRRGDTEVTYAARRPGEVAAKAAGMDNGAASASHGGQVGDGIRFRGRGFLQITGRRNYSFYGIYRGRNFLTDANAELLATDDLNACDASGFYWVRARVNVEADVGAQPREVTRVGGLVNRGSPNRAPLHEAERLTAFNAIWRIFGDGV